MGEKAVEVKDGGKKTLKVVENRQERKKEETKGRQ